MARRRPRTLTRTLRHTRRLQEIVATVARFGLTDVVQQLKLDRNFPSVRRFIRRRAPDFPPDATRWQRVRLSLESLGPTFVKLGQLLSSRHDMLPRELIAELEQLHDDVAPVSVDAVRRVVRRELGRPVEEVFGWFEAEPMASASIAQVHRARFYDGTQVAVKVQRPHILETIAVDLDIMSGLARLAEAYMADARFFNASGFLEEFRERLYGELDFEREFRNIRRFSSIFSGNRGIYAPKVYREYSSERILTMELIRGTKLSEVLRDDSGRFNKPKLAQRGAELMLDQVYIHGFFHGDPHPGNVMVLPGDVLCFLDFGSMGSMRPRDRNALVDSAFGIAHRDPVRVTNALLTIAEQTRPLQRQQLEDEIFDLLDRYTEVELQELNVGGLFNDLVRLALDFGLRMPTHLLVMIKALVVIEGVGYSLDPNFNLTHLIERYAKKLFLARLRPERVRAEATSIALETSDLLRELPADTRELITQLKGGNLDLGFRLRGLENVRRTLDSVSYRLVFGIVLAGLLVSSALIVQAEMPPLWHGIPFFGLVGFVIAGVLGIGFLFSTVRRVFKRSH